MKADAKAVLGAYCRHQVRDICQLTPAQFWDICGKIKRSAQEETCNHDGDEAAEQNVEKMLQELVGGRGKIICCDGCDEWHRSTCKLVPQPALICQTGHAQLALFLIPEKCGSIAWGLIGEFRYLTKNDTEIKYIKMLTIACQWDVYLQGIDRDWVSLHAGSRYAVCSRGKCHLRVPERIRESHLRKEWAALKERERERSVRPFL